MIGKVGDVLYQEGQLQQKGPFRIHYDAAVEQSSDMFGMSSSRNFLSALLSPPCNVPEASNVFVGINCEARLREVRLLLANCAGKDRESAREIALAVHGCLDSPPLCRSWSCYYLGFLDLEQAKRVGELQSLWGDSLVSLAPDGAEGKNNVGYLRSARRYFAEGLRLCGDKSHLLGRRIMRSLALVLGPEKSPRATQNEDLSAAMLIYGSIGMTTHHRIMTAFSVNNRGNRQKAGTLRALFGEQLHIEDRLSDRYKVTKELFEALAESAPLHWRFVAACLCPSGDMLLSCIHATDETSWTSSTVCILNENENCLEATLHNEIVKPIDEMTMMNDRQLQGMDESHIQSDFTDEAAKRQWWNQRRQCDSRLQQLLGDVEARYLGSDNVRRLFLGDERASDALSGGKNLASTFEMALENDEAMPHPTKMTVVQLKAELVESGIPKKALHKLRKAALIAMLEEKRASEENESQSSCPERHPCVMLVLDESLHRFPFEGLSYLGGKQVTRIPTLSFALARIWELQGQSTKIVNPAAGSYVVDPENNLGQTSTRILDLLDSLKAGTASSDWTGLTRTMPSTEFMNGVLTKENGLFLYCGHGGGQAFFSRSRVDNLVGENQGCKSTVILMGCSSGKLVPVDKKHSTNLDSTCSHYEPEGIALSYLCAGAPCVVANLWDVTDRDIDRYCAALLHKFLVEKRSSLSQCVADARSACKLKSIVGLAPVCYGIPVEVLEP